MTDERPTYCGTCILSKDQKIHNQYSCCPVVLRPDKALLFLLALWSILSAQCCYALLSILKAVKCGSSRHWVKFGCCEGDTVFKSNWRDTDSSLLLTRVFPACNSCTKRKKCSLKLIAVKREDEKIIQQAYGFVLCVMNCPVWWLGNVCEESSAGPLGNPLLYSPHTVH